jgi:hypothetical protein
VKRRKYIAKSGVLSQFHGLECPHDNNNEVAMYTVKKVSEILETSYGLTSYVDFKERLVVAVKVEETSMPPNKWADELLRSLNGMYEPLRLELHSFGQSGIRKSGEVQMVMWVKFNVS